MHTSVALHKMQPQQLRKIINEVYRQELIDTALPAIMQYSFFLAPLLVVYFSVLMMYLIAAGSAVSELVFKKALILNRDFDELQ
jgi:hypothetical protein